MDWDAKESAWDGYRFRRKAFWISIPVSVVSVVLTESFFRGWELLPFLSVLPVVVTASVMQFFKCPACGECFFYRTGFFAIYHPWADQCEHCGCPKWELTVPPRGPLTKDGYYPTPRDESPPPDPVIAERAELARFLALVLRDDPKSIGLKRDAEGWVNLEELQGRAAKAGIPVSRNAIGDFLATEEGSHFATDPAGGRIRFRR